MKKFIIIGALISILRISYAQPYDQYYVTENGQKHLLGETTREVLEQPPYSDWYLSNYEDYDVDSAQLKKIDFDSITVFYGSWCGDSKREVPHFLKVLDSFKYPKEKVRLIALGNQHGLYKKSPEQLEAGKIIHRVPVFIFYKEGREYNRIVESPKESFEMDIFLIQHSNTYHPKYRLANELFSRIYENREFKLHENINTDSLRQLTENVYELSTLARVLFTDYKIIESQRIYELNVRLYPEELASNFYLAMFWKKTGNYRAAFSLIKKCYEIAPGSKVVTSEFESLKSRI